MPAAIVAFVGVIAIELSVGALTAMPVCPDTAPSAALMTAVALPMPVVAAVAAAIGFVLGAAASVPSQTRRTM
jgi:hypothetical protein